MSEDNEEHRPLNWSREELLALLLAVGALAVLGLATLLFGFAGLIVVMLVLTAATFVLLTLISRG